ncbi:hypothetical protein [Bacillus sp. 1P02SD]|uniref:hypothetical protein n=1 Tax=Bacillus sp. 1P02SD TaxID=3132264 RepID=UPI0039A163E1
MSPLTVGIDPYDVGRVEEFQDMGGVFLLFLEESENGKLLLPVGGPNGMIEVMGGKIEERDDERRAFFEEFLNETPTKTFEITNVEQKDKLNFPLFLIVAAFVILFILLYLKKRKSIQ